VDGFERGEREGEREYPFWDTLERKMGLLRSINNNLSSLVSMQRFESLLKIEKETID
jgi:hypothetical protein